jgi:hypothetical protein
LWLITAFDLDQTGKTHEQVKTNIKIPLAKTKERNSLADQEVDERIILKSISDVGCWVH